MVGYSYQVTQKTPQTAATREIRGAARKVKTARRRHISPIRNDRLHDTRPDREHMGYAATGSLVHAQDR